jgi:integrase
VRDVCHGQIMAMRALVLQQKTQRPVQFEITEPTREAVLAWIAHSRLKSEDFLFPSRTAASGAYQTGEYRALSRD